MQTICPISVTLWFVQQLTCMFMFIHDMNMKYEYVTNATTSRCRKRQSSIRLAPKQDASCSIECR